MALRVYAVALGLLLFLAGPLLSDAPPRTEAAQETQLENMTELTAEAGLIINIDDDLLTLIPERPFIWCSTIEEPIPLYVETDEWESATIGEFSLQSSSPDWAAVNNKVTLVSPSKSMTGLKLGLAKKTPAVLSLQSMVKKPLLKELKDWCQGAPGGLILIKFAVSLEDGSGQVKYVDPGIGVKR